MDENIINDQVISTNSTWSSKKISDELAIIKGELDAFIETIISNNDIDALFN